MDPNTQNPQNQNEIPPTQSNSPVITQSIDPPPSNQMPTNDSAQPPKRLKKIVTLVVTVLVILGLIFYVLGYLNNRPKKYSENDLIPVSQTNYAFSYPKSWVDASELFRTQFESGKFQETNVYADALAKDKLGQTKSKYAQVLTAISTSQRQLSNKEVKQLESDPKAKEAFGATLSSILSEQALKNQGKCLRLDNFERTVSYNTKFPVIIRLEADCVYTSEQQKEKGSKSGHIIYIAGINNSRLSTFVFAALKPSWDINKVVYEKMADSFEAK